MMHEVTVHWATVTLFCLRLLPSPSCTASAYCSCIAPATRSEYLGVRIWLSDFWILPAALFTLFVLQHGDVLHSHFSDVSVFPYKLLPKEFLFCAIYIYSLLLLWLCYDSSGVVYFLGHPVVPVHRPFCLRKPARRGHCVEFCYCCVVNYNRVFVSLGVRR